MSTNGNGQSHSPYAAVDEQVIGQALREAEVVLCTQLAHAVGLAMQNVVAQQQTLQTINNAIATKALNLLAEQNPKEAIHVIKERETAENDEVAKMLRSLAEIFTAARSPDAPPPSN